MPSTLSPANLPMVGTLAVLFVGLAAGVVTWYWMDPNCPFVCILPPFLQSFFVDLHVRYPEEGATHVPSETPPFKAVQIVTGVRDESEIFNHIARSPKTPILFRSYLCEEQIKAKLAEILDLVDGREFDAVDKRDGFCFGNLMSDSGADVSGWENVRGGKSPAIIKTTVRASLSGEIRDVYAAFVPVGNGSLNRVLGIRDDHAVGDTSFFGYLSRKMVTTPLHANWGTNTLAFQLIGVKQWLLVEAEEMAITTRNQNTAIYAGPMGGVYYPNLRVTPELVSSMRLATCYPGDVLYFPPYCAHAVVTEKGQNCMCALRLARDGVIASMRIHPVKTAKALFARFLQVVGTKLTADTIHYSLSDFPMVYTGFTIKPWTFSGSDTALEALLEQGCAA